MGFRPREAIAVVFAIVAADALIFALPVLNRVMILSGGDDWLTYETMSRDIGLHGLWMADGALLGHGRSFYYQPLYPYFLVACHWAFGDGLFGIYLMQRLLAGAAVVAMWRIFVVPALALALRGSRRRWSALVVLVLTMTAVVSLATMRNWVVAHEFVPITSSGSVNLFSGNTPPAKLVTPPEHAKTYQRLGIDPYTQMVIEYARQKPGLFIDGLKHKAMYALGSFESLLPGTGRSVFYASVWASALAGLVLIPSVAPGVPLAASAIPFLIAAAHFATVVAIFPHVYGDRLVLPFYLLLVPYVAVLLVAVARLVRRAGVEPRTVVLAAATWLAALWTVAPRAMDLDVPVIAIAIACLACVCAERGAA
jgi:hypothetical protein